MLYVVHREGGRRAQELQTVWQPPPKPAAKAEPKVDTAAVAREKARKAREYILQYAVEESESDGEGSKVYLTRLSFSYPTAEGKATMAAQCGVLAMAWDMSKPIRGMHVHNMVEGRAKN